VKAKKKRGYLNAQVVLDPLLWGTLSAQIEQVFARARDRGFDFLCYGNVQVSPTRRKSARASYNKRKDLIRIAFPTKAEIRVRGRVLAERFVVVPSDGEMQRALRRVASKRMRKTLAHEMGHRLYHQFANLLDKDAISSAYEEARTDARVSRYAHRSASEMFAESFACYLYPSFFRESCDVSRAHSCFESFLQADAKSFTLSAFSAPQLYLLSPGVA
jgi:hypothetical protein